MIKLIIKLALLLFQLFSLVMILTGDRKDEITIWNFFAIAPGLIIWMI